MRRGWALYAEGVGLIYVMVPSYLVPLTFKKKALYVIYHEQFTSIKSPYDATLKLMGYTREP